MTFIDKNHEIMKNELCKLKEEITSLRLQISELTLQISMLLSDRNNTWKPEIYPWYPQYPYITCKTNGTQFTFIGEE